MGPSGRPTFCHIDLGALRWNFRQARRKVAAGVKILSVVKADAYGHGASRIARILEDEGSDAFGVATVEEGVQLRQAGIGAPIVVLAGIYAEQLEEVVKNGLIPVICDLEMLRRVEAAAKDALVSGAALDIAAYTESAAPGRAFEAVSKALTAARTDGWIRPDSTHSS